jgi:hypothetical protein
MTDTLPDRLSQNPKSPHYDKALLERGVGIRFNGQARPSILRRGLIRVVAGAARPQGQSDDDAAKGRVALSPSRRPNSYAFSVSMNRRKTARPFSISE